MHIVISCVVILVVGAISYALIYPMLNHTPKTAIADILLLLGVMGWIILFSFPIPILVTAILSAHYEYNGSQNAIVLSASMCLHGLCFLIAYWRAGQADYATFAGW